MVLDVGVVAKNDNIETSLVRKGLYGVDEQEMLRGFEVAMSIPRPTLAPEEGSYAAIAKALESQLIMGMEVRELSKSTIAVAAENPDLYWHNDARFCHIRQALESSTGDHKLGGDDDSFAGSLKAAICEGPEAAVETIASHIVKGMSGILMIPEEEFDLDSKSLASYGLDSMIGAEVRTWLFKRFALDYSFHKLLAPTLTFRGLAIVIAKTMGNFAAR